MSVEGIIYERELKLITFGFTVHKICLVNNDGIEIHVYKHEHSQLPDVIHTARGGARICKTVRLEVT